MKSPAVSLLSFLALTLVMFNAKANQEYLITIKNHQFEPSEITVPAKQKIKLKVQNMDVTAEEFESYELDREKIIAGQSTATIFIGPLEPGVYPFFGEFNPDSARGQIKVE